jgi:Putative restriction endonuclease
MTTATTTATAMSGKGNGSAAPILLMESGDCLSRDEFERRYQAMPHLNKAELIEGAVHLPSPVRTDVHGIPHTALMWWLQSYQLATPGVFVADNSTLRIDLENVFQPDGLMMIDAALGGQARVDADGYISGAPELVGEVSATTASIDLNLKLRVYRRNQVREYIVWRVLDQAIDWFVLQQSEFVRLVPGSDGILRSEVFPGLWLDPEALLRRDLPAVLSRLHEGLASPEHAAFVAKLGVTG